MTDKTTDDFRSVASVMEDIVSEYNDLASNTRKVLQEKLKVLFSKFFEAHPQIKTIHWLQYTPYFNDGDECEFGVHEAYFTKTEWSDIDCVYGEDDEGLVEFRDHFEYVNGKSTCIPRVCEDDPTLIMDIKSLVSIINSEVNEDVIRMMFGDHVWVRAHRDDFEIQDYDHD